MRSTRVALYDIKSGTFDDIRTKAETGMLPLLQRSEGFVSYGVARIDEKAFMSLSTWETNAQANAATIKAADWVGTNSEGHFTLRESFVGDLAIDSGTPITAPTSR
jgi:heme-degrading monooxygenase HmoA